MTDTVPDIKNTLYRHGYLVLGVFLVVQIATYSIPFSGDQVALISHPANFIYNSDFSRFIIPANYDTGHPPFLPALFALAWEIFGRNLFVSHSLVLIFYMLLYFAFIKCCSKFIGINHLLIPTILFLVHPVILAQTISMSADIFLALFFLWGINALYEKKKLLFVIACMLLMLSSLRGVIFVLTLGLINIMLFAPISVKKILETIRLILIAAIPFILWNVHHYIETGWFITHAQSPWIAQRHLVDGKGLFMNIFIFFFRLNEFGFLAVWVLLLIAGRKMKTLFPRELWNIICLLSAVTLLFTLPFKNPILNRYLLVIEMLVLIMAAFYISRIAMPRIRKAVIAALSIFFISAHLYVYPEKFNKSVGYNWDATLAFIPYCTKFREETYRAIQYKTASLMDKRILVGAGFPVYQSYADTELRTDLENTIYQPVTIVQLDTANMLQFDYIIYSNMMNEIPLYIRDALRQNWNEIYDEKHQHIRFEVFENKRLQNTF